MASVLEQTTNIGPRLLKRLSRMYESGISIQDISDELRIDIKTIKRLLKLLGYSF